MSWLTLAAAAASAPTATAPQTYGTPLDWAIIVVYMGGILAFGSFFGRYTKTTKEFFFSGAKFSWWLIGMSMVATGVGSHSFVKYAEKGYEFGMSSGMSYMNDWFFVPFFMFGWLPIIYFARVKSIPEYFERRFNRAARLVAVVYLLLYMIGYIGYNLFTLGRVAEQVLGVEITYTIAAIAVVSGIYITAGGQTAVIFTDLAQGFMLLGAGLVLFIIGLDHLAFGGTILDGLRTLWTSLSLEQRLPFAHFNEPREFNFIGVFWQDGVAGSIMFLFASQGLIMRFMAAKSVNEGRKAILFNTAFILPISMIVVSNAGWLARAFVTAEVPGFTPPDRPSNAFVHLAEFICKPGVFGFILAALSAALMSTIDTLTNATAALFIYDVYQPYVAPRRPDRHYMVVARWVSAITAGVGLLVGLMFSTMGDNMYQIHGAFQAVVTPPVVAVIFMGAFWKRFTPAAALAAMGGGGLCIVLSKFYPAVVAPFAHGVAPDADGQYSYMTAAFGIACTAAIGVLVSLVTRPKPDEQIAGLWIGSIDMARRYFKGREPDYDVGRKVCGHLVITGEETAPETRAVSFAEYHAHRDHEDTHQIDALRAKLEHATGQPPPEYPIVRLSAQAMHRLAAREGDLLYVADGRWWLGGLRSSHCRAGRPHEEDQAIYIHPAAFDAGAFLRGKPVVVEKFF